jgi:hypothetical protein
MAVKFSTAVVNGMLGSTNLKSLFANGVINFYTGAQPVDADSAETGTLLGRVTLDGGSFTPGVSTNGINFASPSAGSRTISKASAEIWKFMGTSAGTIGWFRFVGNAVDNGLSSTTLPRIDGSVGIASGDLRLSSVTAAVGSQVTIDSFSITG